MDFELLPRTKAGAVLASLIEERAEGFAASAAANDRESLFPHDTMAQLAGCGALTAMLPEEFGGLGLTDLHDFAVAMNRLGRADGSAGLVTCMHLFRVWGIARAWRVAERNGRTDAVAANAALLRKVAAGTVMCAVVSEAGTDALHPLTEAVRCEEGWRLNGRKIFATGAPGANLLGIACRFTDSEGRSRTGRVYVRSDAPGVQIAGNWDALGMRGSGSHDVVLRDCVVPAEDLVDAGPWGRFFPGWLSGNMVALIGLLGVFLGIAEAAHSQVLDTLRTRRRRPGAPLQSTLPGVQREVGESEMDLAACRAVLARTASLMDEAYAAHAERDVPMDVLHRQMCSAQCAKQFVTLRAIGVVDRAMGLSGGSGYMAKNPLSRLFRDVRAGPFMQPWPPGEGLTYVGRIALDIDPDDPDP